ncbi:MAG: hypothetical protein ACLFV5_10420 [Anaerolineales bacterium]
MDLPQHDIDVLRELAEIKADIAETPKNRERREAWYRLDAGDGDRVMVLAEHGGVRDQRSPVPRDTLVCEREWARDLEYELREAIYRFQELQDDHVVEPVMNVNWHVTEGDYGVAPVMHQGGDETHMGSYVWDAPIRDLDEDFHRLHPRTFSVDREATLEEKARLEALFDGLLTVRIRGSFYWTMGLTWSAIDLIGLEQLMLAMYDNPAGLHRMMAFLRDDHLAFADWLESEGLYSLNNENDYIGSGSMGYTRSLPQEDWTEGMSVRTQDLWVLSESQETVGVGPEQFEEFVFPYQLDIVERFGKTYYGCCEPVNNRFHIIERIPNLARVSVSPWADQGFMADALGRDIVFSRKPNPALISTAHFDEEAIRSDIRQTLEVAGHCRLEIIMKDVHTLNDEPQRLARWVQIAREEIGKYQ